MMDRMRRIGRIGTVAALMTAVASMAAAARPDDEFRLFPRVDRRSDKVQLIPAKDRLLKPLLADPEEAQTRIAYGFPPHAEEVLDVVFGGNLVLLRWNVERDHAIDVAIRGRAGGRFAATTPSFPLQAADYMGGAAIAWQHEVDTFELFAYHEGSHLGAKTAELEDRQPIDYNRQAARLLWSHDTDEWRVYLGGSVNFNTTPEPINGTIVLHGGAEYYFTLGDQDFYAALDVQVREYNNWNANLTGQIGWFLGPVYHDTRPRLFLEAFTGHSVLGQFWNESETIFSVGLGIGL